MNAKEQPDKDFRRGAVKGIAFVLLASIALGFGLWWSSFSWRNRGHSVQPAGGAEGRGESRPAEDAR